ncbi:hypothetical protein [Kitasatospora phosalacinea]|uniref:Uncharacterized protein n=1 Tax=Kitasatospora phosalacinea TaxID=2065 RepID=A0ABW6GRI9_9ACTN
MTVLQTCRRHPTAGRFLATCSGCAQELYDIQARNEALAAARHIHAHSISAHTETVTSARITGYRLIITTAPLDTHDTYALDIYRRATDDERAYPRDDETDGWIWISSSIAADPAEQQQQLHTALAQYTPRTTSVLEAL